MTTSRPTTHACTTSVGTAICRSITIATKGSEMTVPPKPVIAFWK